MEQLINRHTTASFCMSDLSHYFAMRRVVLEGRRAYKRGTVPLCPYPLIHDNRSDAWMSGWTDRMIEDEIANVAPHGRRDSDVPCRRLVGLCQWRGNEPCPEQATHDLVPVHGTRSRMCEKHYQWLKFLEANAKLQGSPEAQRKEIP